MYKIIINFKVYGERNGDGGFSMAVSLVWRHAWIDLVKFGSPIMVKRDAEEQRNALGSTA